MYYMYSLLAFWESFIELLKLCFHTTAFLFPYLIIIGIMRQLPFN